MTDRKSSSQDSQNSLGNMNLEMSRNMVSYPMFSPYMPNINQAMNHPSNHNPMMHSMNMGPNWQGGPQIPFGWQMPHNSGMNPNYQNYNHEMSGRQSRMSSRSHNTNMPSSSRDTSKDSRYSNTHLSTTGRHEGSIRSRKNTYDSAPNLSNPAANEDDEGRSTAGSKKVDAVNSKSTIPPKQHEERHGDAPSSRSLSLKG